MARGPSKRKKAIGPQLVDDPDRISFPLRAEHLPEMNEQIRSLQKILSIANEKYREGTANGREGALIALMGIQLHLALFEPLRAELTVIQAIMSGLQALNQNGHPSLMQPSATPGQSTGTMLRRQLEAISVFAVERLQGFGFSLDRACEFVADKLVKAGIKGTRSKSPISGRTVRNWKQRMAEDVKDASYVNKAAAAMRTIGLEMDADGLDTPADILELVEMMAEAYASGDFT